MTTSPAFAPTSFARPAAAARAASRRLGWAAGAVGLVVLPMLAACGDDGAAGAQGPAGAAGTGAGAGAGAGASAGLVVPATGLLDRTLEVSVSGSLTTFAEGAKPDFGPGIAVGEVVVSSPTLLTATITIAKDAQLGPRDVSVGGVVAKGAFTVAPALDVKLEGKAEQGAVVTATFESRDTRAFDTQAAEVKIPGLVSLGGGADGPQSGSAIFLVPPLAAPASLQLSVENPGPDGKARLSFLSAPDAVPVTARAGEAPANGDVTFDGALVSKLWKSTATAPTGLFDLRLETTESAATVPYVFVFGEGGKAEDELTFASPPASLFGVAPPPYDVHAAVVFDGATPPTFHAIAFDAAEGRNRAKLTVTSVAGQRVAEAAGAHGVDAPQALGALDAARATVVPGALATETEVDVYRFGAGDGDRLQIVLAAQAELELVVTKDPAVLADPSGTQPAQRKVLGRAYAAPKGARNVVVTLTGQANAFVVVRADSEGTVQKGAYTLGVRKAP